MSFSRTVQSLKRWLNSVIRDMSTVTYFHRNVGVRETGDNLMQSCEVCSIAVTDLPLKISKLHNKGFHVCIHLRHKLIFSLQAYYKMCSDGHGDQLH